LSLYWHGCLFTRLIEIGTVTGACLRSKGEQPVACAKDSKDGNRFDALTRSFAGVGTRRGIRRAIGLALGVAGLVYLNNQTL
jgi:hypothetical protein